MLGDPLTDEVAVLPLTDSLAGETGCKDSATTYVQENKDISSGGCRVAEVPGGTIHSSDDSAREFFEI